MTVLAVMPARLGATRLPRKPLRLLGGVPLIVRVAQRVEAFGVADLCVVATDSDEILDACARAGIRAVLTRADHPSGTDRVAEVAGRPEFARYRVVVNVQGDEPFVSKEAVTEATKLVASGRFSLGTAASPADPSVLGRPDVVKVVCADDDRALYFSRAPIPFLRDQADASALQSLVRQHIGVYAYTREALAEWVALAPHPLELVERLEQLRPLAHGLAIGVARVQAAGGGGIDTEDDLQRAQAHFISSPQSTPGDVMSTANSPMSSTF